MIKNLLSADEQPAEVPVENETPATVPMSLFSLAAVTEELPAEVESKPFDSDPAIEPDPAYDANEWNEAATTKDHEPAIVIAPFKEPSKVETIRRSGLAWSAGVVFFGSVVFTLILGWLVDLLLGSSPWGIVGGIVLGSIIGFVNFFRITSQIFKNG
ncbi:MAG: AtpZ/AtpI family protein [Acidobacteria bacterium]|nr:AtpZ/AtpI family protein [Acidobacteriota bacterium]